MLATADVLVALDDIADWLEPVSFVFECVDNRRAEVTQRLAEAEREEVRYLERRAAQQQKPLTRHRHEHGD